MPEPTIRVPQPYQNTPPSVGAAAVAASQGIPKHLLPHGHPGRVEDEAPKPQAIHLIAEGGGKTVSAATFPGLGGVLMIVETGTSVSCCWVNKPA